MIARLQIQIGEYRGKRPGSGLGVLMYYFFDCRSASVIEYSLSFPDRIHTVLELRAAFDWFT
jgi:hypothetical protein